MTANGCGTRGGNIRDLDTARELQGHVKDKRDWRGAIDEQIRRTLLETGYYHADALDPLCIPPEHAQLKGTRSAWFRNQGFMEKTGEERKVAHKAANGRKAPIHRITSLGREKLVGVSAGGPLRPGERSASPVLNASADPGEYSPEPPVTGSSGEPARDQKPLSLLPEPDPELWAA